MQTPQALEQTSGFQWSSFVSQYKHPYGGCCHCFLFINWGLIQLPLKPVEFFLLFYCELDLTSSGWKPTMSIGACLPELNLVPSSVLRTVQLLFLKQLQFLHSWKASYYKKQNLGNFWGLVCAVVTQINYTMTISVSVLKAASLPRRREV